jgi:acyl dehydratase
MLMAGSATLVLRQNSKDEAAPQCCSLRPVRVRKTSINHPKVKNEVPMRYYEDFLPGKRYRLPGSYHFTEEEIIEFAGRWDPQPFHIDKSAAADSIFGGLVACSSHIITASIAIAVTDPENESAAVSNLGFKEIRMAAPVRPDDTLYSVEDILETRLSNSRPECGIVVFRNDIYNQRDEMVASFQTAALFLRRPD